MMLLIFKDLSRFYFVSGYKMSRPVCINQVSGAEVDEPLCNASQRPEPKVVECNIHRCPAK
jgi:hypothetical protein